MLQLNAQAEMTAQMTTYIATLMDWRCTALMACVNAHTTGKLTHF